MAYTWGRGGQGKCGLWDPGGGLSHKLLLQHHSCPLALGSFAIRILFANLVLVDGVATQGVRAGYVSQGQARGKPRGGLWGKSGASQMAKGKVRGKSGASQGHPGA